MKDTLKKFIDYLTHQKNYSINTTEAYQRDLYEFIRYLTKQHISSLKEVDYQVFMGFLSSLKEKNLADTTMARKVASLKIFFKYLFNRKLINSNPALILYTPRTKEKLPQFLSFDEVIKILEAPYGRTWQIFRDKAILEVLYSTGIRVGELTSLQIRDINIIEELVKVKGKGKKERIVPIGTPAMEAVLTYMEKRPKVAEETLFLNKYRKPLSDRGVERIVNKYAVMAGVSGKISPHTFRHTFASHLLDRGADLRTVQELLGHEQITTTQIYTHITVERLKDFYNKSHPRSKNEGRTFGESSQ
ncbi:tyrosine recombinase XerC [bacterium]|nr:tyrosine recombinase XerC [bacterium]